MIETLNKVKEGVLDILLPKHCLGCSKEGQYICKACEVFLSEVDSSLTSGVKVMSVWEYEGLMEKLIYKIKFDGRYHIIDELVGKAMERINLKLPEDTVITYVPMYRKRERERGFNQAELIARKLGLLLGRAWQQPIRALNLLEKVRDNRSQVGLGPEEREKNVKGVFSAHSDVRRPNVKMPEKVLLVDDVYTTGATAKECVRVLRRAGVKNVWVFTLARKLNI